MDEPETADQQELIFISSAQTQDVVSKTCLMIETDGERERERERVREIRTVSVTWSWSWCVVNSGIGLVSLFNGISTFVGYFNADPFFLKNDSDAIQLIVGGNKGVHTFSKSICRKVNEIAQLEFELAYSEASDLYFNNYAMRTPP